MSDEKPIDQLAVLRAQLDQNMALCPELARMARAIYDAFKAQEFTDSQALYLAAVQMLQNPGTAP
jgi:hypothetical protein